MKTIFKCNHHYSQGMKHGNSILHIEEVIAIKHLHYRYCITGARLAIMFSVSKQTISAILNNKGWKY